MIEEHQTPHVLNIAKIQTMNLSPEEVFIFSRINGSLTVKQIVQMVGFPIQKVTDCLQKFLDQQVIEFKASAGEKKKMEKGPPTIIQTLDEEDKDKNLSLIPRSFRNRIQLIFHTIEDASYFDILEVTPSASSNEVHKSYLRLVKEFHPDRLHVKEPGPYKQKLEKIFEKIQEAYQEIGQDQKRATYLHSLMEQKRGNEKKGSKLKYEYKVPKKNVEFNFASGTSQYDMGLKEERSGNLQAALNFFRMAARLNPSEQMYKNAVDRIRKRIVGWEP